MFASLPMYDLPELAHVRAEWWRGLKRAMRRAGVAGVPKRLCENGRCDDHWRVPDLLFTQTGGYPLVNELAGRVRVIATPCYAAEGCVGADYSSAIVVREDAPATAIEHLRGRVAAVNDPRSQSGYSALRAVVAPHHRDGRFFARVVVTGSHVASLAAIMEGGADVAAIDCVTYALMTRLRPRALAGTRVLCRGPAAPGLPYITAGDADDDRLARLRAAVRQAVDDPGLAAVRAAMLLVDAVELPPAAYSQIHRLEAASVAEGYPELA